MTELDPELASLFAEERARPEPAADAAAERTLARIEASIAAPATASLLAKLAPLVVALAVGGAIGAGVTAKLQAPKIVYVDRPVAVAAPGPATAETVATPALVRSESPSSTSPPPVVSAAPVDTLARERALLDAARASLSKGDAAAALASTERHAREFPRGQMTEEREALAIQSLAKLGRMAEATTRAEAFKTRYPNSVLTAVVDSVTNPPGAAK